MTVLACGDFGDINKNPNASETPLTSALLTQTLANMGNASANAGQSLYCQYISETLYTDLSRYSVYYGGDYIGMTSGRLKDIQNIIDLNTDPATAGIAALNGSNNNQIAIARILKVYHYAILTDRYGDVPYFEAFTADTQPKYDKQEDIYKDFFKELREAVAQFDNLGAVKGDILFNGDNQSWKRFANSWRLILALRISKADPALGTAEFNDALTSDGGVVSSNAENIKLFFPGGAFKNTVFTLGGDYAVSKTVADYLYNYNDRRATIYGHPNFDGFPYGLSRNDAVVVKDLIDESLVMADPYRQEAGTFVFVSYADVQLARAEAAARGWTAEDEVTLYDEGVKASWEQWGVFDQTAYDTYKLLNLGGASMLETICIQRWLTLYPNGVQGWAEWRRTGLPVLVPAPDPINESKQIPRRFIYSSNDLLKKKNITANCGANGQSDCRM